MKKIKVWFRDNFVFLRGKYWFNRCHDLALQSAKAHLKYTDEIAENQLQMDIFQQALTDTFTQVEIDKFFDVSDKLRKEHEDEQTD